MRTNKTFPLSAVSIALVALSAAAWADDAEVKALMTPESSVTVGVGSWSGDRHQLGIFDAQREGGNYGTLDADINKRDDATGTWLKFKARNLGLDNGQFKAEYLQQGDMGLTVEYDRISRDNPNTINTRLKGIGTATLTPATSAATPLQTVKLGTDREITSFGLYKSLAPELSFNLSFKNENKTGTRQWGRGGQPEFAVEPINSTTQQLEMALNYANKVWQLSGGYNASAYDNKYDLVSVTNAGLAVNNTNTTYLSVPLDNQAQQVFLNAGYNLSPTTRATFRYEYGIATQNANLPTSSIPGLGYSGVPGSLKGLVLTSMYQFAVTARPTRDLSLLANLRYHDVDDRTPIQHYVMPAGGCTAATTCVDNTPLGYHTTSGKVEGTYRLSDQDSVTAGVEQRGQDRTIPVSNNFGTGGTDTQRVVPYRYKVNEQTARLEFRRALSDSLNGTVGLTNAIRSGASYQMVAPTSPGNGAPGTVNGFVDISNMINPINIADRERNKLRVAVDWAASDRLSFQFNVEDGRDRYGNGTTRPFGLHDGNAQLYGFDMSYAFNDKWKLNAWYSYDYTQAKQTDPRAVNGGGNAAIKEYNLEDIGNSLGLGLQGELNAKTQVGANVEVVHTLSKYQQSVTALNGTAGTNTVAGFTPGLPDIINKTVKINVFVKRALDKQQDVRFDFGHEIWSTNDWTWMFANGTPFSYTGGTTGNLAVDGTTVTANQNQVNDYLSVRYTYKF